MGLLLAGCGSPSAVATPTPTTAPATPAATTPPRATPTATYAVSQAYLSFVRGICRALAAKNAQAVINDLPYYQYNSGMRWGMLGDGAGTTSDPSQLRAWLANSRVRCSRYTPDTSGHGTLLAGGWTQPGPWALIELDVFPGGNWKINDFTFGRQPVLYDAMQTAGPRLPYRG